MRRVDTRQPKNKQHNQTVDLIKKFKYIKLINENVMVNKITKFDEDRERDKFIRFFNDLNVYVDFINLEVYDNFVFWGGTIDGLVQFIYKVTKEDKSTGVEFNYLGDFNPENPGNDAVIERVEKYFDIFYRYWRNNLIQK